MSEKKSLYQKTRMELFRDLESDESGLSSVQAERRLAQHGPNELRAGSRKSVPRIFLEQFASN